MTLPWKGHPRLLLKVYCEPGPNWYVSETIGQARPLIYHQPPASVPVNSPVGVVSFFSYAPSAVPVALIETSLGASASTYELFADENNVLRVVALTGTDPPGLLAGTNAFLHGEGISCTPEPRDEMTVTQTSWGIADSRADTLPTKDTTVTVRAERWVLGGPALHEVSFTVLPDRTTTYGDTKSLGDVRC